MAVLPEGYERRFRELERALRARFSAAPLVFDSHGTPQATGWFEVSVNGRLVFSKKAGDGYLDTPEKLERVGQAIQQALSASS